MDWLINYLETLLNLTLLKIVKVTDESEFFKTPTSSDEKPQRDK